jgi:DNA-binding transcriptional ArsR family regulator
MERKLQIAQHANLVDEAFILLYFWVNNDDMEETFQKYADNFQSDEKAYLKRYHILQKIYNDIKQHFFDRKERMDYLFKARGVDFATFASLAVLWDYSENSRLQTYEECLGTVEEEEKVKIYTRLIDFDESVNTPPDKLCRLADLIDFLEASSYEQDVKWEILKIYNNQEAYYKEVHSILTEAVNLLESRYSDDIAMLEESFYEYWSNYQQEKDIIETFREKLGFSWKESAGGVIILPQLFRPFGVGLSTDEEEPLKQDILRIGIMMNENFVLTGKRIKTEDIVNIGKILSDKSKVDILELSGRKPCYGKELAEELKLSTATISYHVNALLKLGFLKAEVDSNKVYYSLNRERLAAYLEDVKKYFMNS